MERVGNKKECLGVKLPNIQSSPNILLFLNNFFKQKTPFNL